MQRILSILFGEIVRPLVIITKKSASVQLRRWIFLNKKLETELLQTGFKPGLKILTPLQVSIVVKYFGCP
jgi:hypothetical protein